LFRSGSLQFLENEKNQNRNRGRWKLRQLAGAGTQFL
jgi:hypothetical protein